MSNQYIYIYMTNPGSFHLQEANQVHDDIMKESLFSRRVQATSSESES